MNITKTHKTHIYEKTWQNGSSQNKVSHQGVKWVPCCCEQASWPPRTEHLIRQSFALGKISKANKQLITWSRRPWWCVPSSILFNHLIRPLVFYSMSCSHLSTEQTRHRQVLYTRIRLSRLRLLHDRPLDRQDKSEAWGLSSLLLCSLVSFLLTANT